MLYRSRAAVLDGTWKRPPHKPRQGDTVPCAICGTPFYRQPAYVKEGRKFCSRACLGISQSKPPVVKSCARCGVEMTLKPSQAGRMHCSRRCDADAKIRRPTGRTHNGRPVLLNAQGYLTVYEPTHPAASRNGRVLEHRWVMERSLGRYLATDEHVDHINQVRTDNRLENLQVLSPFDHSRKTNGDRERAMQVLRDQIAAFEAKYGPLDLE